MSAATWRTGSVGDATPNTRRGGDLRMLFGPATGCAKGLFGQLTLRPGEIFGEHYHPYSDEAILVTRGSLWARIDGVEVELGRGEAVIVTTNVRHRLENTSDSDCEVVFALYGLAPRPELGHVETEPVVDAGSR